jgi:phosphoserine phosphatase RsbU/P
MPKLFIYPKKENPSVYTLGEEKISLGRSQGNQVSFNDPFCSKIHAYIEKDDQTYKIRDNQSKNGLFINGRKAGSITELSPGDEILMGSTRIIFDREPPADVDISGVTTAPASIHTMMNLQEALKKPDMKDSHKRDSSDLIKLNARLAVINEVSQALILHRPLTELLEYIMSLVEEHIHMDRGVLLLYEGHPKQLVPRVIRVNDQRLRSQKIQLSQSIIQTAMEKHSSLLISDVTADDRFKAQESIIRLNIRSALCIPLWDNQDIIGIIYADRILSKDSFSQEDLHLMTLLSNLAAIKIENARLFEQSLEKEKMEKELALAASIQEDLLPHEDPLWEGYDIAGINRSCHQVGGDYYDFIHIDDIHIGLVIADVSGKGVSSSLLMASLRAALHAEIQPELDISVLTAKLNNFIHSSSSLNSFISFFFGILDRKTGKLEYVNAGHNPPIILNPGMKAQSLKSFGFCLGMFPNQTYPSQKEYLLPNSVLCLYTDGITETRDEKSKELDEKGLIKLLKRHAQLSSRDCLAAILSDLNAFAGSCNPEDDRTLIIAKRLQE